MEPPVPEPSAKGGLRTVPYNHVHKAAQASLFEESLVNAMLLKSGDQERPATGASNRCYEQVHRSQSTQCVSLSAMQPLPLPFLSSPGGTSAARSACIRLHEGQTPERTGHMKQNTRPSQRTPHGFMHAVGCQAFKQPGAHGDNHILASLPDAGVQQADCCRLSLPPHRTCSFKISSDVVPLTSSFIEAHLHPAQPCSAGLITSISYEAIRCQAARAQVLSLPQHSQQAHANGVVSNLSAGSWLDVLMRFEDIDTCDMLYEGLQPNDQEQGGAAGSKQQHHGSSRRQHWLGDVVCGIRNSSVGILHACPIGVEGSDVEVDAPFPAQLEEERSLLLQVAVGLMGLVDCLHPARCCGGGGTTHGGQRHAV